MYAQNVMMETPFKQVCQDIQKVSRQQREDNNYITYNVTGEFIK